MVLSTLAGLPLYMVWRTFQESKPPLSSETFIRTDNQDDVVVIDGKFVGTTPLRIRLDEGKHRIRILRENYFPLETTFVVAPDSIQTFRFELVSDSTKSIRTDSSKSVIVPQIP